MTRKIILSGGGTGGHIYPAVAVAEALKRRFGDGVEILFVGAEGKMEMEKVPALGYRIVGLPIAGLQRRMDWHNLAVPFKVLKSVSMAKKTIREFGADAVVGFGGYASAPVLWAAQRLGVPTVIQEQNSYAGLTNKILAKRAKRICVAYEGMERFFPAGRITMTGNPLRGRFSKEGADRGEALEYYGFTPDLPVVLVVGGSLGTRSLNEMMKAWILALEGADARPLQGVRRGAVACRRRGAAADLPGARGADRRRDVGDHRPRRDGAVPHRGAGGAGRYGGGDGHGRGGELRCGQHRRLLRGDRRKAESEELAGRTAAGAHVRRAGCKNRRRRNDG